jgi:hypothetical protein
VRRLTASRAVRRFGRRRFANDCRRLFLTAQPVVYTTAEKSQSQILNMSGNKFAIIFPEQAPYPR